MFLNPLDDEDKEDNQQKKNLIISIMDPVNGYTSTILTSNLSVSLARQGFKTLLFDLSMIDSSLALLAVNEKDLEFTVTTTDGYVNNTSFNELIEFSTTFEFPTGGSFCLCPASYDIKKRLKIKELTKQEMQSNLTNLLSFFAFIKPDYDFIFINMPNSSEYPILVHGTLAADFNFLLMDHNQIAISHGLDLLSNLEKIHPLIEFHGVLIHRFVFSPNMNDEERLLIESAFKKPIVALLPEIPMYYKHSRIELLQGDCDIQSLKYFKILSHELLKFVKNPPASSITEYNTIEMILITNKAGIPLFQVYIIDGESVIPQDEIITSAVLTAILIGVNSAVKEISKSEIGETKLIKLKNSSLIVETNGPLVAMFLTGKENEDALRQKLLLFFQNFQKMYSKEIKDFIGNTKPFQDALHLVEEIF